MPRLSLAEWLVLCLVCEAPSHGFALARTLSEEGELGFQPSNAGPVRSLVDATDAGRDAAAAWLAQPAPPPGGKAPAG